MHIIALLLTKIIARELIFMPYSCTNCFLNSGQGEVGESSRILTLAHNKLVRLICEPEQPTSIGSLGSLGLTDLFNCAEYNSAASQWLNYDSQNTYFLHSIFKLCSRFSSIEHDLAALQS